MYHVLNRNGTVHSNIKSLLRTGQRMLLTFILVNNTPRLLRSQPNKKETVQDALLVSY